MTQHGLASSVIGITLGFVAIHAVTLSRVFYLFRRFLQLTFACAHDEQTGTSFIQFDACIAV